MTPLTKPENVAATTITPTLIEDAAVRAVTLVFNRLVKEKIAYVGMNSPIAVDVPSIMGNVGFVGALDGLLFLRLSDDLATYVTSKILGVKPSEFVVMGPDMVKDTVGEMTNMAAGGLKNVLSDKGFKCKLTVPTIIRGTNLKVRPCQGGHHFAFEFDTCLQRLTAEIQVRMP